MVFTILLKKYITSVYIFDIALGNITISKSFAKLFFQG